MKPHLAALSIAAVAATLAACSSSGPPPPDWQAGARSAIDAAVADVLRGDSTAEARDFARARAEGARTGRPEVVARLELMRCAAHVASLAFDPCAGFEALRADAGADERAYADHLAARHLSPADIERLPAAQRSVASAIANGTDPAPASLQAIEDTLARAIAVAVLFEAGRASPAVIAVASDTASQQGWQRPLMAWLQVQARHAEAVGDAAEAQRLRRRLALMTAP